MIPVIFYFIKVIANRLCWL